MIVCASTADPDLSPGSLVDCVTEMCPGMVDMGLRGTNNEIVHKREIKIIQKECFDLTHA